ncbi:RagB/SusD family nutrient uptake outer membrane protein [Reichenbachiella ulvae]|uniref:RagB/SusD family nutrient uptake outer membrane protein n=1 Tax=Reichenbachiella ulvae TaxID=2980104 RepID=A0ABT3CUX6_9BACT|nr:RagB/SusD family nutrient uptake outer membrane protein [Reichenbachiella ulvae]MCV9387376.1 RagB/SusD family nutrient uptake outer membrane protein [Reichenbachiella ulvae]
MIRLFKNKINIGLLTRSFVVATCLLFSVSCSEDFLEPEPLSFYEPNATFSTESGLRSALAICDRHIRSYWVGTALGWNNTVISTEYLFSDMAVYGKTDVDGNSVDFNFADNLTPTGGIGSTRPRDGNNIGFYWNETYNGIKYANTVLTFVDDVEALSEEVKNAYKGRAYFHRAYRYMALVFQFGDVPLITKLLEVPKQNYRSTEKAAILEMITKDMEFAVEWVPEQAEMTDIGAVNKGACRMLLAKCYLAIGEWDAAEEQLDILINQSGYSLMQNSFGSFIPNSAQNTWPITRNVIWDLHRPENKLISTNSEVIMGMPNRGAQSFMGFHTMRIYAPFYNGGNVRTPSGGYAVPFYARNNDNYSDELDYGRALGRGIGTVRPSVYAQHGLWEVNGVEDNDDLRHNSTVGNWARMDSIKYTEVGSPHRGENLTLHDPVSGDLLCADTIRCWYEWPHYKLYIIDAVAESNQGANSYLGASVGSNADWYLYRLAEAYLLRAEAKYYKGDAGGAAADVNVVRERAQCSELYAGSVTIGDIVDERARELYMEEWRHMELSRVSYCLALSGQPDEWGNTYDVTTYDKQQGTDASGGSYWYQRVLKGGFYNIDGGVNSANRTLYYKMDKRNLYWPIPNYAITANNKGQLSQNFGYDGYNPNTPKWTTWEEAVADEDNVSN